MKFIIKLEPEVYTDIQQAINYYNTHQKGLGRKFVAAVKLSFEALKINPFYEIRYQNIRCFSIKSFPFLIHYTVNELLKTVTILANIHTSLNPDKWYID